MPLYPALEGKDAVRQMALDKFDRLNKEGVALRYEGNLPEAIKKLNGAWNELLIANALTAGVPDPWWLKEST